jgi:3-oxoadipate enol-lactonase
LLDHVGFETANIHGTSSGGLVGLNLAVRNPDRVKTLILNGLYVRPDTYWRFYNRVLSDFLTHAGIGRGVAAFVSERNLGGGFLDDHPEVVDKLILPSIASTPLPIWQAWLDEASTIDLVSELDQCAVRTLLISGEHDRMLDVAPSGVGMRRMQEMMRVAELNILAGAGHFTAIERPGEHARAVIAFVNSGPDN